MRRFISIALMTAGIASQLPAQLRIAGLDGLASKATEAVDITLNSTLLQMAGGFLAGSGKGPDDAKAKELLAGLKGITVKSFKFKETGQYRMEDLEPIRTQLRTPEWSKIVSVQSKGEINEIYTRTEKGKMSGFVIIAAQPRELTVVAIDGAIDINDLSKLKALGVPSIPIPNKKGNKE